jgi:hypothetical protein
VKPPTNTTKPVGLSAVLSDAIDQCIATLLRDHQLKAELENMEIARAAARKFAKLIVPTRPGRPRGEAVRVALDMREKQREQGQHPRWRPIFRVVLPGWPNIPERFQREYSLRRKVKRIEKRGSRLAQANVTAGGTKPI